MWLWRLSASSFRTPNMKLIAAANTTPNRADKIGRMGKLYEFGGLSIEHGDIATGHPGACEHLALLLDENGQTVSCTKCGAQVSAWWALLQLVQRYDAARTALLKLRPSTLPASPAVEVLRFPEEKQ